MGDEELYVLIPDPLNEPLLEARRDDSPRSARGGRRSARVQPNLLGVSSITESGKSPRGPKSSRDVEEKDVYFETHVHPLKFNKGIEEYYCDECGQPILRKDNQDMWSCRPCNYDMCALCASTKDKVLKKTSFDLKLTVVGGCWNINYFPNEIHFALHGTVNDKPVKATPLLQTGGFIEKPISFTKQNLSIEQLKSMHLSLLGYTEEESDSDSNDEEEEGEKKEEEEEEKEKDKDKEKDIELEKEGEQEAEIEEKKESEEKEHHVHFEIDLTKRFNEMVQVLQKDSPEKVTRFWNRCDLKKGENLESFNIGHDTNDLREDFFTCKVPVLYSDIHPGFLRIECRIVGLTEKETQPLAPSLIDDIEVVKVIIGNGTAWNDFQKYLTADVYVRAFEIYVSKNWRSLLNSSIDVLKMAADETLQNTRPGNWESVYSQCQEIVSKLLSHLPREGFLKSASDSEDCVYGELKIELEQYALKKIVTNELKVFSSSNSFYDVIFKLWLEPSANLWPFKIFVSPLTMWRINILFFILFLVTLTYHIYVDELRQHRLFLDRVDNDFNTYDDVTDFDSYIKWFNSSFIPTLYDSTENHLYMLTDDVLIRQIRIDPIPCTNQEQVPLIDVPQCYPRLGSTFNWSPAHSSWENFTFENLGKSILYTKQAYYGSSGYSLIVSKNFTEAEQILSQINYTTFLDWSVQAIIAEFVLYSPNSDLFAVCAVIGEFSNVGIFMGSHDCAVVSPKNLSHSSSWTTILLYIFFTGFSIEELWELIMIFSKERPQTKSERKEAKDTWNCCLQKDCDACCDLCYEDDNDKACCCTTACYIYSTDLWNALDLIMIVCGYFGLIFHNNARQTLSTFTLEELWHVVFIEQVSQIFISICVIITYFRFLNFLIPWKYIGVLVLTVFKMLEAVVRFGIIFFFIALGFSAAFHILYDNNVVYSSFAEASLTTFLGIFAGYNIPEYGNLLSLPNPGFGYFVQTLCVIIGVVLLLNFLIAMMNSVYEDIVTNAETEYRWMMTRQLTEMKMTPWPVPLNLLQGFVGFCSLIRYCITDVDVTEHEVEKKYVSSLETKRLMFANMVVGYFRETLGEEKYKESLRLFDKFETDE